MSSDVRPFVPVYAAEEVKELFYLWRIKALDKNCSRHGVSLGVSGVERSHEQWKPLPLKLRCNESDLEMALRTMAAKGGRSLTYAAVLLEVYAGGTPVSDLARALGLQDVYRAHDLLINARNDFARILLRYIDRQSDAIDDAPTSPKYSGIRIAAKAL